MNKPPWLNKRVNLSLCREVKMILRDLAVHTVCEEAFCPNISDCFREGAATFMILGDICTRRCQFCAVNKGKPEGVDDNEPKRIKEAVRVLNLKYVVITSPTRDDREDGGAELFAQTVKEIKSLDASIKVEILIPDFLGRREAVKKAAFSGADVIAHNLETVPSLYPRLRQGADYRRSLEALRLIKEFRREVYTKSALILGLGEEDKEISEVFGDLRGVNCDFLTLGQYLPPSLSHFPVKEYIFPEKFLSLEKEASRQGFLTVKSSPYTRSSYRAHTFLSTPLGV